MGLPSVVPDYAKIWFEFGETCYEGVNNLYLKARNVALTWLIRWYRSNTIAAPGTWVRVHAVLLDLRENLE
jgi:hypothetical protein